jgi:ubiquitin-conjugating enzyme E2 Q
MALNEIVNAPKEYVSSSPHLVVAQLDWIQTRYLFVKSADATAPATASGSSFTGKKPTKVFEQDPSMTPRGIDVQLIIPANALPGSRRNMQSTLVARIGHKRLKTGDTIFQPIEIDDDDNSSVATLDEDRTILEDSDDELIILDPNTIPHAKFDKGKSKIGSLLSKFGASKTPSKPLTDFVPGTLDFSKLPMLQQPTWATPGATKRLMRDFQELVKVQQKEPLHELGWYIDPEHAENMYQWIVELHSFDPQLPLAKDMKAKKITSIVLELRFGNQYPMTPPFVRVIRPRFLGFQQGGGGHVTAGGAMCMEVSSFIKSSARSFLAKTIHLAPHKRRLVRRVQYRIRPPPSPHCHIQHRTPPRPS